MPNPKELTFGIIGTPHGTFGVQCWNHNRTRTFGVDHRWLDRAPAERALCVYLAHPEMHGKTTEAQVQAAYDDLLRTHRDAMEGWVEEAAADLGMDAEVVWHDVTVSYLTCEVHGDALRADLARGQGIPLDALGPWKPWEDVIR